MLAGDPITLSPGLYRQTNIMWKRVCHPSIASDTIRIFDSVTRFSITTRHVGVGIYSQFSTSFRLFGLIESRQYILDLAI